MREGEMARDRAVSHPEVTRARGTSEARGLIARPRHSPHPSSLPRRSPPPLPLHLIITRPTGPTSTH